MRRCGFIFVFLCTILASGATLTSSVCTTRFSAPAASPDVNAGGDDGVALVAAARGWIGGQPRHWRACLLQHP
jgi:hypothetical protein